MKINIKIEKKRRYVKIPLTVRGIRTFYDSLYRMLDYYSDKRKLKKYEKKEYKEIRSLLNKFSFLVHDVIDEGKTYTCKNGKFILNRKPHYIERKLKWK